MSRTNRLLMVTLLTGVLVIIGLAAVVTDAAAGQAAPGEGILTGTITSAAGERLEGVTVSARGEGKSFTVSVYTDAQGAYYFPPMATGRYKVWAQAVTFDAGRAIVGLTGPVGRQDFALKPLENYEAQLRGDEWVAALPEATPEDRRMKEVFRMSCGGCHSQNMTLLNRFDEKGWLNIITVMSRISTAGWSTRDDVAPNPLIDYYKERLAAYLAKARGPGPSPMKFTPRPRPTGEETLMVVREYDGPGNGYGLPLFHDGSDWSLGYPGKLDRKNHHVMDGTLDFDGNVWFSDDLNTNPYRTVGKIDWKTGQVSNVKVPRRSDPAMAAAVHDLVTDHDGILWFGTEGNLYRLDPRTLKWEAFTPPEGTRAGGFLGVDGKGGIWSPSPGGALRFDPSTRTWTQYKNPTQKSKLGSAATYGAAGDSDGNGWLSQHPIGIMVKHNSRTGESEDVVVPKRVPDTDLFTGEDRRIFQMMGGSLYQGHGHPEEQAIRKPGGGPGPTDAVWGPGWIGDNLVKIDIRTNQATLYPFPWRDAGSYQATVDKDGIVWVNFTNADAVGRFDPKTEKWTMYQLPTLGTEVHGMQVVTVNGRPMLMVPEWASGKAARLEFRTNEELQALRAQVQQQAR